MGGGSRSVATWFKKHISLGRDGLIRKVCLKEKVARFPLSYRSLCHVACQNTTAQVGRYARRSR